MNEASQKLYYEMLRIRRAEETIADRYAEQKMRCPVHLSIGQEAVPVGICAHLSVEDHVFSNHRCHAHYLAKGGDLKKMIAELYGKVTGCVKGKGGSMHLVDTEVGMMGASALVGGTIPMAVGSALSHVLRGSKAVTVVYFGDGALDEGILYESLNFAALKKLPVIFVCENNLYATYSHRQQRHANVHVMERAKAFGVKSLQIDGNDVECVVDAAGGLVAAARNGEGPSFIECMTYRWRDHVGPSYDYEVGYRTKDELNQWMRKCPIQKLGLKLPELQKQKALQEIEAQISEAFRFAEESPLPPVTELFADIYA